MLETKSQIVLQETKNLRPALRWLKARSEESEFFHKRYSIPRHWPFWVFHSIPTKRQDLSSQLTQYFQGRKLIPLLQHAGPQTEINIDGPIRVYERVIQDPEKAEPTNHRLAYSQLFRDGGVEAAVAFEPRDDNVTKLSASWLDENWEQNEKHSIRFNMKEIIRHQEDFGLNTDRLLTVSLYGVPGQTVRLSDGQIEGDLDRLSPQCAPILLQSGGNVKQAIDLLTELVWNAFGLLAPTQQPKQS